MTNKTWLDCCNLALNGQRAEIGVLHFLDGIAAFMADRTNQSILHLCLAFEILANKHRMIVEKKSDIKLDKLIKQTPLLNHKTRKIIKYLMVDRGHAAHGRDPHHIRKTPDASIQAYVRSMGEIVNAYLVALGNDGKWHEATNLKIG